MSNIFETSIVAEFHNASLGDQRLNKRLLLLAEAFARHPRASIPVATGDWGQACAAYRFLDHSHVQPQNLLAPHILSTRERAATVPLVLAVNDTTTLNYSGRPATTGLGPIGSHADKMFGLHLHSLLAFTPQRQPLGILAMHSWARDPLSFGIKHRRHLRPVAEKESAKWLRSYEALRQHAATTPATRWVFVADREADLYELFEQAHATASAPALLVRMNHDRSLEQNERRLFAELARAPQSGELTVNVPSRPGQAARVATVTIRFCPVRLRAPVLKKARPSQSLWAIEAREEHPPRAVAALHWRLLTTLAVESLAQAVEKVEWYCVRWGIEVFHKVLKSGCGVEDAQLETAERLQCYVTMKMVVAWRVMALTHMGRARPDALISELLEEAEWQVLRAVATRGKFESGKVPTVLDALRWVGKLGGHLGRRGDGLPGPLRVARGLQRLTDLTTGWKQAKASQNCA